MKLHVCVKPKPDELLYGWLCRIAEVNGCRSLGELRVRFFEKENFSADSNVRYSRQRPDILCGLEKMCGEHEDVLSFPTVNGILKYMLPFYGVLPFWTYGYQARWTHFMLLGKDEFGGSKQRFLFDELKICPECLKEDRKHYGFPVLHAWHHMPAVHVCAVHGAPLYSFRPKVKFGFEEQVKHAKPVPMSASLDMEMKIAAFMKELYEKPIFTDLRRLQALMEDRLEALGISRENSFQGLNEMIREAGFENFLPGNCEKMTAHLLSEPMQDTEKLAAFTAFLFEDVGELRRQTVIDGVRLRTAFLQFVEGRYRPLSEFGQIVKLECLCCGHIFHTHPYALSLGVECPMCTGEQSAEEKINRRLRFLGNGAYELVGKIDESGVGHAKILHRTCGKIRTRRLADAIWMGKRCQCENGFLEEEVRKQADILDYEYIKAVHGKTGERKYVLRHKECGMEFEIDRRQFARNLICPYCDCRNLKRCTDATFRQEVKALTGDEYTVESPYQGKHTKIKFLHHMCGTVTEMTPEKFLHGQRCRLCSVYYQSVEIRKMVENCTGGAYQVGDMRNSYYTITDQIGNVYRKKAYYILQELKRPTRSPFFKIRLKAPEEKKSLRQSIYLRAKGSTEVGGVWSYRKGCMEGFSVSGEAHALRDLVEEGYLEHVGYGKYRVCSDDKPYKG